MTQSRILRGAVIGLGGIGDRHLRSFALVPGAVMVAGADPRADHAAKIASQYGLDAVYTDYNELLKRDDIDFVTVGTPNHLHAPVTLAALEAGKHVLCEKPLARTAAEAEAMVRMALERQRVLRTAFNYRWRGDVQVLKQYIDQGSLGRVYHAKATWMRRKGIPGWGAWFISREQAGGGPLIDLGVHVLDMAMYLLGEPQVVAVSAATYAELGTRGRGFWGEARTDTPYEVEDFATAFIRLANGVTLNLEASWAVYGRHNDDFGVTLFGTEGGAEIDVRNYADENTLTIFTDTADTPTIIKPQTVKGDGHVGVARDFIASIVSDDWSNHIGRAGLRRAQIIEACYQSAQEGREIPLVDLAEQL